MVLNSLNIKFPVFRCEISITVAKTAFNVIKVFSAVFFGRRNKLASFLELQRKMTSELCLKLSGPVGQTTFHLSTVLRNVLRTQLRKKNVLTFRQRSQIFPDRLAFYFQKGCQNCFLSLLKDSSLPFSEQFCCNFLSDGQQINTALCRRTSGPFVKSAFYSSIVTLQSAFDEKLKNYIIRKQNVPGFSDNGVSTRV